MLNCGKIQLNLQLYYMRSKEYMVAISATKRPRNIVHTGGLHKLTVRVCNMGLLKNHPIKESGFHRVLGNVLAQPRRLPYDRYLGDSLLSRLGEQSKWVVEHVRNLEHVNVELRRSEKGI